MFCKSITPINWTFKAERANQDEITSPWGDMETVYNYIEFFLRNENKTYDFIFSGETILNSLIKLFDLNSKLNTNSLNIYRELNEKKVRDKLVVLRSFNDNLNGSVENPFYLAFNERAKSFLKVEEINKKNSSILNYFSEENYQGRANRKSDLIKNKAAHGIDHKSQNHNHQAFRILMLMDNCIVSLIIIKKSLNNMDLTDDSCSKSKVYRWALRKKILPRSIIRALDYMNGSAASCPTIQDIADEACCSIRTLQRNFLKACSLTPMQYMRCLRFRYVRDSLMRSSIDDSVTSIAVKYGFTHLGQFSCDYRKYFNETPSLTLKRSRSIININGQ